MEITSDVLEMLFVILLTGFLVGYTANYYAMNLVPVFFTLILAFAATALAYAFVKSTRKSVIAPISALITALLSTSLAYLLVGYDALLSMAMPFAFLFSFVLHQHFYSAHIKRKETLYRVYLRYKNTYILAQILVFLAGLALTYTKELRAFGIVIALTAPIAFFLLLFFLAPLIRIDNYLEDLEELTREERLAKRYIKTYGKKKEVLPFYAAWLGTAIDKIYDLIDSLEAKGYLGHNFFAIQNIFYWFVALLFLISGALATSYIYLPALISGILLIIGVALLGPQYIFDRKFRRLFALILLLLSYYIVYYYKLSATSSGMWFIALVAALISIYFAYVDREMLSALFASIYLFALYLFAWYASTMKQADIILPLASAAAVFVIIASEAAASEKEF